MKDPQPGERDYDDWRNLTVPQVEELVATPGWADACDPWGRNAVMNALYCFASQASLHALLDAAHSQGVFAQLCQAEDWTGARLPVYALREGTRDFIAHDPAWRSEFFAHGVLNAQGQGLLAQWLARAHADDADPDSRCLILRGKSFAFSDVARLSPNDWQGGVSQEALLDTWGRQVLSNDAIMGVVLSDDFTAMESLVLPLFRTTPAADWDPLLARCMALVEGALALLDLEPGVPESRQQAAEWLDRMDAGLEALVPYRRARRHPLVPYLLHFNGWGDLWEALEARWEAQRISADTPLVDTGKHPARL